MKRNVDIDTPPSVRTNTRSARIRPWLEYDLGLSPQRKFFGWSVDLLSPNLANTIPLHKTSIPDWTKPFIRNDADSFESRTTTHIWNAFFFHPGRMTSICHVVDSVDGLSKYVYRNRSPDAPRTFRQAFSFLYQTHL